MVLVSAPLEIKTENTSSWRREFRRRNSAKVHLKVMLFLRLTAKTKVWVYSYTPSIVHTIDSHRIPDTDPRLALT